MSHIFESVFVIPLGAFLVAIVAIIAGVAGQANSRRIQAEQRMAMLARGVPVAEIEAVLHGDREHEVRAPRSTARRLANSRLAALVLISAGFGIIGLGAALAVILQERDVLCVCAAGLVPFAIGVGFFVDYRMQAADASALGLPMSE